ncbi:hypothetical protein LOC67_21130 [Stieleria sp. JC731]|uniref:hypothetical protein n=1 Tax=Pirellulaceae TaxID=2691357 RepID=UPI001E2C23E9|nr:hypothetical protein [Stieleria sp. JC731]MCC9603060.1 hypothetical protein [Stieleria sp. JC731]
MNQPPTKPTARPSVPRFQISLSMMLLLMVVFAFISAALFYASRVPVIREELSMLIYGEIREGGEDAGRLAHRAFIMFTFTSPLLLAATLSLAVNILERLGRR